MHRPDKGAIVCLYVEFALNFSRCSAHGAARRKTALAASAINGNSMEIPKPNGQNHSPGLAPSINAHGRYSGLPSSSSVPAFPCTRHSGVRTNSSGLQQRGLRRNGGRCLLALHRLPVQPSGRKAGGHLAHKSGQSTLIGLVEQSAGCPHGGTTYRISANSPCPWPA